MNGRVLIPLIVGSAGLALACASGEKSSSYDSNDTNAPVFDEDICPSDAGPLDPIVAVETAPYHLSGSARRTDDGGLEIVLNPIVNTDDGSVRDDIDLDEIDVLYDGESVIVDALQRVEAGDVSIASDIVFVLDTTGSMFWAIDGVKAGINQFVDVLDELGIDAQVGGIEFGDDIRTGISPTNTGDFRDWVGGLSAYGGDDAPENPLDAIESAWEGFEFRPGAQRYMLVITDVGMHEAGNEAGCSTNTLADIVELTGDRALYGVLMATLGGESPGVPVQWLTDAMGGLYVEINVTDAVISFDISVDTDFDELLGDSYVLTIAPESIEGLDADEVDVTWNPGSRDYTMQLPVE